MCGIAGYINNNPLDTNKIKAVIERLHFRGPDDNGWKNFKFGENKYLSFIQTRLSILDVSKKGHQPFFLNSNCIIFNGEIYNYLEIKKELQKLGHKFKTKTDTEVLLAAYNQFGSKCVELFEGMWALAIFDSKKNIVFISRDRFGEKPLYFYKDQNKFIFSSDTKAIEIMLGRKLNINELYIKNFLSNGFRCLYKNKHTQFADLSRAEPAENITVNTSISIKKKIYWKPKIYSSKITLKESIDESLRLLKHSLKIRLRADVPLSFCLSGGMDSSSLVGLADALDLKKINTYSVIDQDSRYNEEKEINFLVNYYNIKNKKIMSSNLDIFKVLKKITKFHHAPVSTISYLLHSELLKRVANDKHKVIFSGTGADEIFAGYYDHSLYWLALEKDKEKLNRKISMLYNNFGKFIKNDDLKDPYKFIKNINDKSYLYDDNDVLKDLTMYEDADSYKELVYSEDILKNRMANDLWSEVVPVILDQDDKNSMMYSIENRSPFLDSNLVSFTQSIPSNYFFEKGYNKYILREAMKEFLPDEIKIFKQKKGFNASIKSVLNLQNKSVKRELLDDSLIFQYINYSKFKNFLELDHKNHMFSKFLFRFISVKVFLEEINL